MSEAIKLPFDPIPVGGGTAMAEPPRPAFSRSAPETPTGGLLPPKKPAEKTPPVTLPVGIAPETPAPNPAPGTPPPNPTAVGGLLQDLIRPSRSKLAIAAGMVSLFAGAYGLNLVMPTTAPSDKKQMAKKDEEKKPTPTIEAERTSPKPILERSGGIVPVGNMEPAPAPVPLGGLPPVNPVAAAPVPLPSSTTFGPAGALPLPEPNRPNFDNRHMGTNNQRDQHDRTAAPPPNPFENKSAALPLPLPAELPKLPSDTSAPAPGSPFGGGGLPPVQPDTQFRGSTPAPLAGLPEPGGLPQPKETLPTNPINLSGSGTPPGGGLPALPPIEPSPGFGGGASDNKPVPLPAVPFGGEQTKSAELPKLPVPTNPAALTSNNTGTAPIGLPAVGAPGAMRESPFKEEKSHSSIGLPGVKESPFKEERATPPALAPALVGNLTPAGGSIPVPATSVVESTPKTDFDVDLVRVRSSDTYASISEAFYGSKQYAAALRAFNRGSDLGQLREVQVPPMHVIRKQAQERDAATAEDGRGQPTGGIRGPVMDAPVQSDNSESIDWGSPGKRRSSVRYEKYTVPREGMTAREVAKAVYDDEREWAKLSGARGARLRADDPLPRGTEITVPREELPWK